MQLSTRRKNYAQIDNEGLAIVRKFLIFSDLKLLQHLFIENIIEDTMLGIDLECIRLLHPPQIRKVARKSFATTPADPVILMETLDSTPVTARQLLKWASTDPTLSRVRKQFQHGWTCTDGSDLKPHFQRRAELSVLDGCIYYRLCRLKPLSKF